MKIAIAYNPFDKNKELLKKSWALAKLFNPNSIEIVYVASTAEPALSLAFDIPESIRFSQYPLQEIQKHLKENRIKADHVTVLGVKLLSTSGQSLELARFLKKKKFDFTILPTHARKGVDRFFQGSFVESMILHHQVPLLVFNPKFKVPKSIRQILFGHDLSKTADRNLKSAFQISQKLKANLISLYVAEPIYSADQHNGFLYAQAYRSNLDGRLAQLSKKLQKLNPKLKYILDQSWASLSEIFLKQSKRNKTDLIIMNSKANSIIAALGGSGTRQVIRGSENPVLVLV